MDRSLGFPPGPAVAQDPEAIGTHCSRLGLGLKPLLGRFCGESFRAIENPVVVNRVRGEPLDVGFVLKGSDGSAMELGQGEILWSPQALPLREHRLSIGPKTSPGDNGGERNCLVEPIGTRTPADHRLDGAFGAPQHVNLRRTTSLKIRQPSERPVGVLSQGRHRNAQQP